MFLAYFFCHLIDKKLLWETIHIYYQMIVVNTVKFKIILIRSFPELLVITSFFFSILLVFYLESHENVREYIQAFNHDLLLPKNGLLTLCLNLVKRVNKLCIELVLISVNYQSPLSIHLFPGQLPMLANHIYWLGISRYSASQSFSTLEMWITKLDLSPNFLVKGQVMLLLFSKYPNLKISFQKRSLCSLSD